MKTSPYIVGKPFNGGEAFISRADILRDVVCMVRNPNENGMVLYGQRLIGKTSVLLELAAKLSQQGSYAPVYFDLQDKAKVSLEQVLHTLAAHILYTLDIPPLKHWREDFLAGFRNDFLPHVLARLPAETTLVILFDEFDIPDIPSEPQAAGVSFFPYLRDLLAMDTPRIKFIFTIGRKPEEFSRVYLSLFKGVSSGHISLLSQEDTAALIRLAEHNDSLRWPDEVVEQIYELTGGHPFLTQQLCQVIWENLYHEDRKTIPIVQQEYVEQAIPETLKRSTTALEWLWDGLDPAERLAVSALAEAGPAVVSQEKFEKHLHEHGVRILIGKLQHAPKLLQEWDMIQVEEGGYRIPVEMLRWWIVNQKPLSQVQDELDRILPVADSLFQTARGFYQEGLLQDVIPLLRQAVGINPNHFKAHQLLAEIFLAHGKTPQALSLLEMLYTYRPSAARPRFIQALLTQAKEENDDRKKIALYDKVLELDPDQPEANAEHQKILDQGNIVYTKNISKAYKEILHKARNISLRSALVSLCLFLIGFVSVLSGYILISQQRKISLVQMEGMGSFLVKNLAKNVKEPLLTEDSLTLSLLIASLNIPDASAGPGKDLPARFTRDQYDKFLAQFLLKDRNHLLEPLMTRQGENIYIAVEQLSKSHQDRIGTVVLDEVLNSVQDFGDREEYEQFLKQYRWAKNILEPYAVGEGSEFFLALRDMSENQRNRLSQKIAKTILHEMLSHVKNPFIGYAVVVDKQGIIRAHSDVGTYVGEKYIWPEGTSPLSRNEELKIQSCTFEGIPHYDFAAPVKYLNLHIGTVHIGLQEEYILRGFEEAKKKIIAITVTAVLLGAAGAFIVTMLIRKRFMKLAKDVEIRRNI